MSDAAIPDVEPLLFGYGFEAGELPRQLTWQDVEDGSIARFQRVWLHLNRQSKSGQAWLLSKSGLDWLTVQALLQEETRPRATKHGQGFLINLRGVNLNEGSEPEDMVALRMWASEHLLVTMRARVLQSARDVDARVRAGDVPDSNGGLVAALANALTDRMEPVITALDDEVDQYEDDLLDPKVKLSRSALPEFRRRVLQMRRYLAPQRDALATLVREGPQAGMFTDQDAYYLRETMDRVTRMSELIETVRERSTVLQEELIQESTEETNQRLFVLAILSAVFLPLSFVTGLFGVNLGGMPGSGSGSAFALLVVGLSLSTLVTLAVLRWRRWI
ncbi:MAG: zinc transporter ZntB [Hyphomonas sp.]|nr:zinc transporter ZntB [Hyphomonas sp.]